MWSASLTGPANESTEDAGTLKQLWKPNLEIYGLQVDKSLEWVWFGLKTFCDFFLTIFPMMPAVVLWNLAWNVQIGRSEWGCQAPCKSCTPAASNPPSPPCRNSRNTTFSMRWLASGFQDQRRSPSTSRSPSRSPAWWTSATTHSTSTRVIFRWRRLSLSRHTSLVFGKCVCLL